MRLHKGEPKARPPHDKELIERQIPMTDRQIGQPACGLTEVYS